MMQKLRNVKQVVGNTTHELPNLGIVIERERELLHMIEYFRTHTILNLRTHLVSVIPDKKSTITVNRQ